MEKVGTFYIHLKYIFGTFYGHLVAIWYIFPRFGILCVKKNLPTLIGTTRPPIEA
jgi:hypothetical protein